MGACWAPAGGTEACGDPEGTGKLHRVIACEEGHQLVDGVCYSLDDPETGCGGPGAAPCPGPAWGPGHAVCKAVPKQPDIPPICDFVGEPPATRCDDSCCACNHDGECDRAAGEGHEWCPTDCSCGDGVCDGLETPKTCGVDCTCGIGACDDGEQASDGDAPGYCPKDCHCGDGQCLEWGETVETCPADGLDETPPRPRRRDADRRRRDHRQVLVKGTIAEDVAIESLSYATSNPFQEVPLKFLVPHEPSSPTFELEVDAAPGQHTLIVFASDGTNESSVAVSFVNAPCPALEPGSEALKEFSSIRRTSGTTAR